MDVIALSKELTADEAKRNKPYVDTVGKTTIGVGRNLDDVGLSEDEIQLLLSNDIKRVLGDLDKRLPWWRKMSEARQRVLANMCFNLGLPKLLAFTNTLAAMARGDYVGAAIGMLDSRWASQVGARATRLANMMKEG